MQLKLVIELDESAEKRSDIRFHLQIERSVVLLGDDHSGDVLVIRLCCFDGFHIEGVWSLNVLVRSIRDWSSEFDVCIQRQSEFLSRFFDDHWPRYARQAVCDNIILAFYYFHLKSVGL